MAATRNETDCSPSGWAACRSPSSIFKRIKLAASSRTATVAEDSSSVSPALNVTTAVPGAVEFTQQDTTAFHHGPGNMPTPESIQAGPSAREKETDADLELELGNSKLLWMYNFQLHAECARHRRLHGTLLPGASPSMLPGASQLLSEASQAIVDDQLLCSFRDRLIELLTSRFLVLRGRWPDAQSLMQDVSSCIRRCPALQQQAVMVVMDVAAPAASGQIMQRLLDLGNTLPVSYCHLRFAQEQVLSNGYITTAKELVQLALVSEAAAYGHLHALLEALHSNSIELLSPQQVQRLQSREGHWSAGLPSLEALSQEASSRSSGDSSSDGGCSSTGGFAVEAVMAAFLVTARDFAVRSAPPSSRRRTNTPIHARYVPNLCPLDSRSEAPTLAARGQPPPCSAPGFSSPLPPPDAAQCIKRRDDALFITSAAAPLCRRLPSTSVWALTVLDGPNSRALQGQHPTAPGIPVFPGVNTPVGILSEPLTSTAQHIEDLGMGSINTLWYGAPKAWFLPSPGARPCYHDKLHDRRIRCKQEYGFWPQHLVDRGICAILQQPCTTVLTLPGDVWHLTTSLGASFAESVNGWAGLDEVPGAAGRIRGFASDVNDIDEQVLTALERFLELDHEDEGDAAADSDDPRGARENGDPVSLSMKDKEFDPPEKDTGLVSGLISPQQDTHTASPNQDSDLVSPGQATDLVSKQDTHMASPKQGTYLSS